MYHRVHPFPVYNPTAFSILQSCATIATINFITFSISPKENNYALVGTPLSPTPCCLRQPIIYILSL